MAPSVNQTLPYVAFPVDRLFWNILHQASSAHQLLLFQMRAFDPKDIEGNWLGNMLICVTWGLRTPGTQRLLQAKGSKGMPCPSPSLGAWG